MFNRLKYASAMLAVLAMASAARADTTPITTVTVVWQYRLSGGGNSYIYVKDAKCGTNNAFVIASNDPQQGTLLNLALSAYLARKQVTIDYEASTCRVLALKLR